MHNHQVQKDRRNSDDIYSIRLLEQYKEDLIERMVHGKINSALGTKMHQILLDMSKKEMKIPRHNWLRDVINKLKNIQPQDGLDMCLTLRNLWEKTMASEEEWSWLLELTWYKKLTLEDVQVIVMRRIENGIKKGIENLLQHVVRGTCREYVVRGIRRNYARMTPEKVTDHRHQMLRNFVDKLKYKLPYRVGPACIALYRLWDGIMAREVEWNWLHELWWYRRPTMNELQLDDKRSGKLGRTQHLSSISTSDKSKVKKVTHRASKEENKIIGNNGESTKIKNLSQGNTTVQVKCEKRDESCTVRQDLPKSDVLSASSSPNSEIHCEPMDYHRASPLSSDCDSQCTETLIIENDIPDGIEMWRYLLSSTEYYGACLHLAPMKLSHVLDDCVLLTWLDRDGNDLRMWAQLYFNKQNEEYISTVNYLSMKMSLKFSVTNDCEIIEEKVKVADVHLSTASHCGELVLTISDLNWNSFSIENVPCGCVNIEDVSLNTTSMWLWQGLSPLVGKICNLILDGSIVTTNYEFAHINLVSVETNINEFHVCEDMHLCLPPMCVSPDISSHESHSCDLKCTVIIAFLQRRYDKLEFCAALHPDTPKILERCVLRFKLQIEVNIPLNDRTPHRIVGEFTEVILHSEFGVAFSFSLPAWLWDAWRKNSQPQISVFIRHMDECML